MSEKLYPSQNLVKWMDEIDKSLTAASSELKEIKNSGEVTIVDKQLEVKINSTREKWLNLLGKL